MSSSTQSSSEPLLDINTVAAEIRQAIMDGKLVPGQRLVEVDLCREFNASRGVVRSAIFDLTHEGLLERRPNRGAEVRRVSVDEAIAITELRMVVEALCASKAALLITDEEIRELRQLGEDLKSAVANADHARYTDLNQLLHARVQEISRHTPSIRVLNRLRGQGIKHQFRLALKPGRPQVSLPEHLAIIDEVCARSPEGAERATVRHLQSVIDALRELG